MLDPLYGGNDICAEETNKAVGDIMENSSALMADLINYLAKTDSFHS